MGRPRGILQLRGDCGSLCAGEVTTRFDVLQRREKLVDLKKGDSRPDRVQVSQDPLNWGVMSVGARLPLLPPRLLLCTPPLPPLPHSPPPVPAPPPASAAVVEYGMSFLPTRGEQFPTALQGFRV